MSVPALSFNGVAVRDRGEMLNLTDMWIAAGSLAGQRPDDWRKDAANRAFLDHVAVIANAPVEGIWKGTRGRGGGTVAHWQIGLAYAKWLSPEFHAWANTVVRERMEARHAVAVMPPAPAAGLDAGARSAIGGIVKGVLHRELADELPALVRQAVAAALAQAGGVVDPSVSGVVKFKPALAVCEAAPPKRRRGLVHRVSAKLLRYSVQHGHPLREEPFTGRRMFHVDAIAGWLGDGGRLLLAQHNADAAGMPVLPFRPRSA